MANVKGLNVRIGADVTDFENSIKSLNRQTYSLTGELRKVNQSLKFDTKNPTLLAQKQQILNERYTATNTKLSELQGMQKALNNDYKAGKITTEEYNEQMRKQGQEIAITESKLKGFGDELKSNEKDLTRYSGVSGKAIANLEDFGDKASSVSRDLAKYSVAATALLGSMAKVAIDFESAFANVQKTMSDDVTPQQLDNIKKGIIDLSKVMPAAATEIAEVAANASQMGVAADDVLEFSEVMIKMGTATDLNAERAATAMARFNKVMGKETHDSVDRLGSAIVEMGNNFETTENEIMEMAMRLAAASNQVGMSRSEVIGLSASLTSMGISAESGGTAFSKVLYEMNDAVTKGGANLEIFAQTANMTTDQFVEAFGKSAPEALSAFLAGLDGITKEGGNAKLVLEDLGMKEARVTSGVLSASAAHESMTDALKKSNKAWEENIALNEEYDVFANTTENRLNNLKNQFMALGIEMGEHLLPHIENFATWLGNLINKFGEMDEGTQKFILSLIGITAVAAPAVGAIGKLAQGTANVIGVAKQAGSALGMFGKATDVVSTMAGGAIPNVAGIGGALGGVGTSAGVGAGGIAGFMGQLGGLAVAALPAVAAVGGIALVGAAVATSMNVDAIPAIDLFADHAIVTSELVTDSMGNIVSAGEHTVVSISEQTEANVGEYVRLADEAQLQTLRLFSGVTEATQENINNLKNINAEATSFALEQGEIAKEQEIAQYQEVFDQSTTITAEQKAMILEYTNEEYEGRAETMRALQEELAGIYDAIAEQGGNATQAQKDRINQIQEEQRTNAVNILSETEAEAKVINNRMKEYGTRISAEQAQSVVQEYNTMRDETIKASEAQRDATVKLAEEMRAKNQEKFGQMADDMIKDANRMHKETVDSADKLRVEGLEMLEDEYGDLTKDVDLATGEMIKWWQNGSKVNKDWNKLEFKDKSATVTTTYHDRYTSEGSPRKYNNGLMRIPYDGYLALLHKDERILKKHEADQLDRQGYLNTTKNKIAKSTGETINNVDNSQVNNNINISGITIREEADLDKLVNKMTRDIERKKR